jgi:2-amino-4-hydroxy-6-hydroxymethyldihydropteridine diphosphokinase
LFQTTSNNVIAIGANLVSEVGDPIQTITCAISALREYGLRLGAVSRFFTTPCFPAGAGPDYVNAAAVMKSELPTQEILAALHAVEARFGRIRDERWAGRTLDLDLILSGDRILPDTEVVRGWIDMPLEEQMRSVPSEPILPHPRVQDRAFVLVPVVDVAAKWVHPVLGVTMAELMDRLPQDEIAQISPL